MRFKINIEYVQSLDPADVTKAKSKKKVRETVKKYLEGSIMNQIERAHEGHGYSFLGLEESLKFAYESGSVKVNVEYIDDDYE